MVQVTINYLTVLAGAVISMVLGAAWYGVFAKQWSDALGKKVEDLKKMSGLGYAMSAVGSLLMSYILAHFVQYTNATTLSTGAATGFWIWLGFVLPLTASANAFQGNKMMLTVIDGGYRLVQLLILGALLAVWK